MSRLLCLGGTPGAGKTTVGRAVAAEIHATVVDLDSVTTPLVEAVATVLGVPVDLDVPPLRDLRAARYACLAAVTADALAAGVDVVAIAPFTGEAGDAASWREWATSLGADTAVLGWIELDPETARKRVLARGTIRDRVAADPDRAERPAPVIDRSGLDAVLDGSRPVAESVRHLSQLLR